ncbi:hypothetical protein PILCRDRAFT_828232 [Piloderma croceum F 1598]|uniref:Uncharacterized protein n=1 Tax=Piloderma croceum (strain F 1598) TaxID=765440 RepID=A0A0C3F375_PILCF|nr:hypothetical protein PILCRDRAFT_828232 [Piloderma croceum F 1598]
MGCIGTQVSVPGSGDSEESSEEYESQDESGSEKTESIDQAVLHTVWDVESAKEILETIATNPKLTVFNAIRSQWGTGIDVQKAAEAHIEGMYESGYAEPSRGGWDMMDMLRGTRNLAEKLLQVKEYDAAFFFAHEVAAMIRRCESEAGDNGNQKKVDAWAKALDTVMWGAVKGWRAKSGNSKKQRQEAATLVKLLDEGEREKNCDQKKWYPETLKALRVWAK